MESRRRPRCPPPAYPKLLSVDGQSGLLCEQLPEVPLDAETQSMRFRLPLLRRPGSDPAILASGFFGTGPHTLRNWRSRRSSHGPGARPTVASNETTWAVVPRSVPASGARNPPTPRYARIRAAGAGRTASARKRAASRAGAHFVALLVHLPGRCTIRGGEPRCRRWSGVSAQRGLSAHNDCQGSRTTPLRRAPPFAPTVSRGSDRRRHQPCRVNTATRQRGRPNASGPGGACKDGTGANTMTGAVHREAHPCAW